MTERQTRYLAAIDHAIANGGIVASHKAIDDDGWFFPIDIALGSSTVADQLFRKGIFERRNAGMYATRWQYRRKVTP